MRNKSTWLLIALFLVLMLWLQTAPAQTQSPLQKLAASMAPGTWALLNQPGDGSGYDSTLTQSGLGTGGLFTYASKMAYDPVRQRAFFIGSGHNGGDPAESYKIMKFIAYDGPVNKWLTLVNPKFVTDLGNNLANSHGYQLQTVGQGQLFKGWGNTNWMFACDINKADINTIGGDNCPGDYPDPLQTGPSGSTARGFLEYFPDRNSLLWGETAGGELYEKPLTGNWTWRAAASDMAGDGHMAAYNSTAKVVVFGGGNAAGPNRVFRKMDVSGAITRIDDAPVDTYAANCTVFAGDPLSSKFILIRPNGTCDTSTGYLFYDLDTTRPAGTQWIRRAELEAAIPNLNNNHLVSVLATTISDAGVVMFNTPDKVYLYKHSPGTGIPPANTAPVVSCPANQTVTLPASANLVASAKDDGLPGPLTYLWSSTGAVTFSAPNALSTSAHAAAGSYPVKFMANDGAIQSECSLTLAFTSTAPPTPTTDIPSLQDEKATYQRWGWTWTAAQEPPNIVDPNPFTVVANPTIHDETEGDDLWTYTMQHRRTGASWYQVRATAWNRYFKEDYLQCKSVHSDSYCYDKSFGSDHFYGTGLLAQYEFNGDTAALNAAKNLALDLAEMHGPNTQFSCYLYGLCLHYGLRGGSRHLMFVIKLAEVTKEPAHIALRDKVIASLLADTTWDPVVGGYFHEISTDAMMGAGSFAAGARLSSPMHNGLMAEAMWQALKATGNPEFKTRIIAMARFAQQYGLDPTYQYTGSFFGRGTNGQMWHNYSATLPATFWAPVYTTEQVNLLVMAYKLTGDVTLLESAKVHFNRGTKGIYGSPTARQAPDNAVGHFIDTEFQTSTGGFYLEHNKGELLFTYLIFENGGLPTVIGSEPPPQPNPPTVTLTAAPSVINAGEFSALTWASLNASSVTLNGVSVGTSGSQQVKPEVTTLYTATATGAVGTATSSVTVTVNPVIPPTPEPDPCLLKPLTLSGLKWPTQRTGNRSLSWNSQNQTIVSVDYRWPPTAKTPSATFTDNRGCKVTYQK